LKLPLVTSNIAQIAPYEPGKPLDELERELGHVWPAGGAIKLASNENPLGPSPRAVEAAARALAGAHRYPDGSAFYLRERLAQHLKISEKSILIGSGSNELIDLLVQTFCGPDEEVLAPACSFSCYRLSTEGHRRRFRETENLARFAYDLPALARAAGTRTKLVFLANPNNPTGAYASRAAFAQLVDALPPEVILVVDEAYFEYARAADYPSALEYLSRRERLVVLRTFSKVHGLAGLRVGYAVAHPQLIELVHHVRLPFNVSAVGQAAAHAALDDEEHVERSRRLNATELPLCADRLAALGLDVLPSEGNFLLVGLGARDGRTVYDALLHRGVIVRPMGAYGLPHHLRITVGTAAENARLGAALADVLGAEVGA
jgi:histidinol-phosphate aminotransferase